MCGLVAFAGLPDARRVESLIADARRRGPDMLGVALQDGHDWAIERFWGRSWPALHPISIPLDTRAMIAHARLTTSGTALQDAQPLDIRGMIFAHNGTVYRHEELAHSYGFETATRNDSEILGLLISHFGGDPIEAYAALCAHQGPVPQAWIAAWNGTIQLASFGQPLYYAESGAARYACSWRFADSRELKGAALTWEA